MGRRKKILNKGERFGRLTVIKEAEPTIHNYDDKVIRNYKWKCLCDCGNNVIIATGNLTSGGTKSCGCYNSELTAKRNKKHGLYHTTEYKIYRNMLQRCYNVAHSAYLDYGGRGIRVCDRWLNSFENFYEDMGERPSKNHTLDRVNNSSNYNPENCRWATRSEQANNTRRNIMLTLNGKTQSCQLWSKETGIEAGTIRARKRAGWSDEEALTTLPIKNGYTRKNNPEREN